MTKYIGEYKYIILLFLTSVFIYLIFKDLPLDRVIGSVVVLFLGSFLLSFTGLQFHRKYKENASHLKWWFYVYVFMILFALIP
jgi:hypothetical protein